MELHDSRPASLGHNRGQAQHDCQLEDILRQFYCVLLGKEITAEGDIWE